MKPLILLTATLFLFGCKKNYTGVYESFHMHNVVKQNDFVPRSTGFLSMPKKAIFKDFAPLKLSLSKERGSYNGSLEIFMTQSLGMMGPTDDTNSVILPISSTVESNDTLFYVVTGQAGLFGSRSFKGFITTAKGETLLGIDQSIIEDIPDANMNPLQKEANSQYIVFKAGSITDENHKNSYRLQKNIFQEEYKTASKHEKDRLHTNIVYIDSVLLKQL